MFLCHYVVKDKTGHYHNFLISIFHFLPHNLNYKYYGQAGLFLIFVFNAS
jgi:hypothetical protein